jgi:hypothetical protein
MLYINMTYAIYLHDICYICAWHVIYVHDICYIFAWHMLYICMTYVIYLRDVCYICAWHMLYICMTYAIYLHDICYIFTWRMLYMCMTYVIYLHDICYIFVWHMLCICMTLYYNFILMRRMDVFLSEHWCEYFEFITFFTHGATAPTGAGPLHYPGFRITIRYTTLGRTSLDKWSVRHRDLNFVKANNHKRETSMPLRDSNPQFTLACRRRSAP